MRPGCSSRQLRCRATGPAPRPQSYCLSPSPIPSKSLHLVSSENHSQQVQLFLREGLCLKYWKPPLPTGKSSLLVSNCDHQSPCEFQTRLFPLYNLMLELRSHLFDFASQRLDYITYKQQDIYGEHFPRQPPITFKPLGLQLYIFISKLRNNIHQQKHRRKKKNMDIDEDEMETLVLLVESPAKSAPKPRN